MNTCKMNFMLTWQQTKGNFMFLVLNYGTAACNVRFIKFKVSELCSHHFNNKWHVKINKLILTEFNCAKSAALINLHHLHFTIAFNVFYRFIGYEYCIALR